MNTKKENPSHIGIIMDGNRRFAKRLNCDPSKGHKWGAEKFAKVITWAKDLGIKKITTYTLSIQNFNRPKKEFDYLMDLFTKEFNKLKDDKRIYENEIKIRVLGRTHLLPKKVQEQITEIEERTKNHNKFHINFALAYGAKEEIIDTTIKIATKIKNHEIEVEDINEELFRKNLYMDDEPDLIIRTGGDNRTSNFLMFQSAYSEWFFLNKMWPEFEKSDLIEVIEEFTNRKRRFGK
jgi:tritrans,polycis-undecaprenyl-diphosphate synthase [geranylgeranyl-diphosphate specific]